MEAGQLCLWDNQGPDTGSGTAATTANTSDALSSTLGGEGKGQSGGGKRRGSGIISVKRRPLQSLEDRFKAISDDLKKAETIDDVIAIHRRYKDTIKENDRTHLHSICERKIYELTGEMPGSVLDDLMTFDKRHNEYLAKLHEQALAHVKSMVMNGEIETYIKIMYNQSDNRKRENLGDLLTEVRDQIRDEYEEDDPRQASISHAINQRESFNKNVSLLRDSMERQEENLLRQEARKKPNIDGYAYTKDELKNLCFNNRITIEHFTKHDYQKNQRLYRSYITINGKTYGIKRRNNGEGANKLRAYLSIINKIPRQQFITVNFSEVA